MDFMCMCVREKKNNSFEIHVIVLTYLRNVNLSFKKDLKLQNFLPKHPFSFAIETVLKMAKETN